MRPRGTARPMTRNPRPLSAAQLTAVTGGDEGLVAPDPTEPVDGVSGYIRVKKLNSG